MSRMFKTITRTWNVFTGCDFGCTYCWARKFVEDGRLKNSTKYKECGFNPTFHRKELSVKFKPGEFVFVSDLGDLTFCSSLHLDEILDVVSSYPLTDFLIETKGIRLYKRDGIVWPANVYHGETIETNRDTSEYSKAPPTFERYEVMALDKHPHKFVSIEPVMDFDPWFFGWIQHIMPEIVEIGADNYHHNLPEPPWEKVESLMSALSKVGIRVIEKDGLRRLQKSTPKIRG